MPDRVEEKEGASKRKWREEKKRADGERRWREQMARGDAESWFQVREEGERTGG